MCVVGENIGKDMPVGNVDDAPCALVVIGPIANFEKAELEQTGVDNIASVIADKPDPVANATAPPSRSAITSSNAHRVGVPRRP